MTHEWQGDPCNSKYLQAFRQVNAVPIAIVQNDGCGRGAPQMSALKVIHERWKGLQETESVERHTHTVVLHDRNRNCIHLAESLADISNYKDRPAIRESSYRWQFVTSFIPPKAPAFTSTRTSPTFDKPPLPSWEVCVAAVVAVCKIEAAS